MRLPPTRYQRSISAADLHAAMVAPLGAAATAVVPVAAIVAAAAIAPVVMAIATMIVAAETVTVAAMIATRATVMIAAGTATGTIVMLAIATIALRFGGCGGAEAESRKGEPCGDEMRKLHGTSSRTRVSGCHADTAVERHGS
ncbi:membrane hypothetical protein [Sphingomonas aurantiaca]|uniref:Uncharacterized protein n=1 Tax=Sphingomonas aurantiaca TaxID=185949 RepID=A0A5E7ZIS8_9SPHN|nr:membrane hypothetical protein [Sphingomonas aurantiaca]